MNCDLRNLRSEMFSISDGIGMKKSQEDYISPEIFYIILQKKVARKLQPWSKIIPSAKRHDRDI